MWYRVGGLLVVAALACGDDGGGEQTIDGGQAGVDGSPDAPGAGVCADAAEDPRVSGTLAMWRPLAIDFDGPAAAEGDADPNPFTDYRLEVELEGPSGQTYVVPGFFAGDGDGGGSGSVWRARFSADEAGTWSYEARFRAGEDVALSDETGAGTAMAPDGETGSFCVEPPGAGATGFYAGGRLGYAGDHYLRLATGEVWIKGGADSPENFLGYAGFDNTVDQAGGASTDGLTDGVHRYEPHTGDWNDGDPDWGSGDGRGIIGALNYLASEQVNSIYFLPCNLGGDGRETYPYVAPDDLEQLDISKLAQWEIVFAHAQALGIALHVVLNETEAGNENLHDDGQLGRERTLYYRELVARFAHHPALFWNIGEENDYGETRQKEFAAQIDAFDAYDHPTTVHTHVNNPSGQYDDLVGDAGFDLTSIQLSPDRADEFVEAWRSASAGAGRPWVVMLDEIAPAGTGLTDSNHDQIRKQTLWPALLSGAGGVEWYFGYHDLPLGGDMRTEDFRTREAMWRFTRHARSFVAQLPVTEMAPDDDLLSGNAGRGDVFAQPGEVYAVYLEDATDGGDLDLSGASGDFTVRWYDPRAGEFAGSPATVTGGATVDLGDAPSEAGDDWVVLVEAAP